MRGDDPPLIAGRIHGIRAWDVDIAGGSAELRGHGREAWAAGGEPTVARCLRQSGFRSLAGYVPTRHRSPGRACACGLYALHPHASLDHGLFGRRTVSGARLGDAFPDHVAGIVEAWGRIELHRAGFRAEFARPHTLALVGAPRESDVGNFVVRLAERYGAEVVELEAGEELAEYCREHGLGLAHAVVRSLLPDEPPDRSAEPASSATPAPRPKAAPSRLERVGSVLGMIAMVVFGVLWYGGIAVFGVLLGIGVIRGIGDTPPAEFPARHLRIVDQALVEIDGRHRFVAIVRNTSEGRLALAAFPHGTVRDRAGEPIVRLADRSRIDTRPSLVPGATGLIVDVLPGRREVELPERMRYDVAIQARRAPAPDGRQPTLSFSHVSLERTTCRLAVMADAARPLRGAGIGVVARDRKGAIRAAGAFTSGRLTAGRSREVVFKGRKSGCPGWWRSTEVYPHLLPEHLAPFVAGA